MSTRLLAISALLASCAAVAQVEKPNGIKIGDGRLHPFIDFEGRYDSAVFNYAPPGASPTEPLKSQGDFAVRFRPGLRFELLGTENTINFNGNAEYVLYTGAFSPQTTTASRFQADVALDAAFNKAGSIEFQLGDQFVRSDRTNNPLLTIGVISLYNNVRISAPIHPGGGALEVSPKLAWAVELFEPLAQATVPNCTPGDKQCDPAVAGSMNYSNLTPGLGARWRFLPKTAVVFDGGVDIRTYFTGGNQNAILMKLQVGLAGLVSSKLSVLLLAGYGHDFARSTPGTFIAQAEAGILLSDVTTFKLGYVRTMAPVPVYGIFGDDRAYLEAKFGVGRFSLLGTAAFDFLTFYGTPTRSDQLVTLSVSPSIAIFSWFSVGAAYNLNVRLSSASATVPGAQFIRHEAILKLSFSY